LVCWGNIQNYELFVKKLQSISIIGDKLMGTLAQKWFADGKAEGEARGKAKGKIEVAKSMLKAKFDPQIILEMTGLTAEAIAHLQ
jgi:predicted transposase/invertase (TIGR01784 family)